jgi:hypothetical protein
MVIWSIDTDIFETQQKREPPARGNGVGTRIGLQACRFFPSSRIQEKKKARAHFELAPILPIAIALLLQVTGGPACLGTNGFAGNHKLNPAVGLAS